jgi:hypothetical protein
MEAVYGAESSGRGPGQADACAGMRSGGAVDSTQTRVENGIIHGDKVERNKEKKRKEGNKKKKKNKKIKLCSWLGIRIREHRGGGEKREKK